MQKRSSQLNMQLTQLRKENTSIAEVRVWIPASLNFLRLSFCNCITISAFTSSSYSSNIWNSYKFIIQLFTFNMVDNPCGSRVLMLFQFHWGLGIILHLLILWRGSITINFVIHILQLVKPSWNRRNPLSVVVLKIEKKDGRYLCGLENLT